MNFEDREAGNELNNLEEGKHRYSTTKLVCLLTRSSQKQKIEIMGSMKINIGPKRESGNLRSEILKEIRE